jgi:hypothetical protein
VVSGPAAAPPRASGRRSALRLLAGAAAVLLTGPDAPLAQGCSMCRTAIESADDPLARGINLSVALLVSAPFAIAGSIGGWLAWVWRRGERGGRPAEAEPGGRDGVE